MLDIPIYTKAREITPFPAWESVIDEEHGFEPDAYPRLVEYEATYQLRYVVHRQYVGFFTPMVFDVRFKWVELDGPDDRATVTALNRFAEPFVESALFMDHESSFIVDMLKGQEAGINRKIALEDLRIGVEGKDAIWYSDWTVPPITKQGQRIVVYDKKHSCSMLDPVAVVKHIAHEVERFRNRAGHGFHSIFKASIVAGYVEKQA